MLMFFAASIVYTIIFHGVKLWLFLTFEKRSHILAYLVVLKSLLLTFDILTNGLLFYKVLVFKGAELFMLGGLITLTLTVVGPSPIITLTTNGNFHQKSQIDSDCQFAAAFL